MSVIFEYECKEGYKTVNRQVWLMSFTQENLGKLWENSKEHRILFTDDLDGDFQKFCQVFFSEDMNGNLTPNGLLWVVDDFIGVLFMSEIKPREALLHFSFFDGRLRFDISQRMIKYIFDNYHFVRLNAEIVPFANKRVFRFIEDLGFKKEGEKRKALVYKGKEYPLIQCGLLREEFEEAWDTKRRQLAEVQQKT